ncbi:MAG: hypothetical protein FJX64_05030 [Alphaproteobacteria bacterium]|nr:hypothetical protein [Alphaproteobacteria bacterium]
MARIAGCRLPGVNPVRPGWRDCEETAGVRCPPREDRRDGTNPYGRDGARAPQAGQGCELRQGARGRRGFDLLDRLDEIRMGLLMGAIPKDRLGNLVRLVRARRDGVMDPKLTAILDDIELRAMVELAKLGQYP